MPRTRKGHRGGWMSQLRKLGGFKVFHELLSEILTESLPRNLYNWQDDTTKGENLSDAGKTADVDDSVSRNENIRLTPISCNLRMENEKLVRCQLVSKERRTTLDTAMSSDSCIEEIVLDSDNEVVTCDSIPNEKKSKDASDILLTEQWQTDDNEYERVPSIGDTSDELIIDLSITAEEGTARSHLPASADRFWDFVESLTNAHQTEKEGWSNSAEYKSAPKTLTHQGVESKGQVPKTACTKSIREDLKRKISPSREVVKHKRKSLSPISKDGSDDKTSQLRFDEELAKLDKELLCTAKLYKAARLEKSSARKNAPSISSTSALTKKVTTSTARETVRAERMHDTVKSKKFDILEHQKVDVTRKRSAEETTVRNKEYEYTAEIKKGENLSFDKTDLLRKKHSEDKTVKSRKPEKIGSTKRRCSEGSTVTSKRSDIPSPEKPDETKKRNSISTVPELIADKIGSDTCKLRSRISSNSIKLNLNIHSTPRTSEPIRSSSVHTTKTSHKKESTMNVIVDTNKIQITNRDIFVETSTTVDSSPEGDKSNQITKPTMQRKREYETVNTDCPLKKQKKLQCTLAADATNINTQDHTKGVRSKLRNLFGNICTISEEAEEDKLIQRRRRKRKHSIKSNDSAISLRETNVMCSLAKEVLNDLENLPDSSLNKKYVEHKMEIPLDRLGKESINYICAQSKKMECLRKSPDILTKLPVIKENSTLLKNAEVDNCQDNKATTISTPSIRNKDHACKDNTRNLTKSTTKEEEILENNCPNTISSDVVSSAEDRISITVSEIYPNLWSVSTKLSDSTGSLSEAETLQNDKASHEDEHIVSSTQDSKTSVITDSTEETHKPELQEDSCELLATNVAKKSMVPCQIISKGNMISVMEITDANQNIIKKEDSPVCNEEKPAELHVASNPTNDMNEENKSKEVEKHSEEDIKKETEYNFARDMPLLDNLLNSLENYGNIEDSIPQTNPIIGSSGDITDTVIQTNSVDNITPSLQSNNCTPTEIIEPPPCMVGKLRVRTCEELGSRWCPTPATISTSDESTIPFTNSTIANDSSNSSSTSGPNSVLPNFQILMKENTQTAVPENPQAKDLCNTVTITVQNQKTKGPTSNEVKRVRRQRSRKDTGVKTCKTVVCYPKKSGLQPYTDPRQSIQALSNLTSDSRSVQNAPATNPSCPPLYTTCYTGIPARNSSSVQVEVNALPGQPKSVAATAAPQQYPVYSSGNLLNGQVNGSPLVTLTTPKPTCTATSNTAVPVHKNTYLHKQTQENPQANAVTNVRNEFRIPASVSRTVNSQPSIFTQNTRIVQGASLPSPMLSVCQQKQCPQHQSGNGTAAGSLQQSLYHSPNLSFNMQHPIHISRPTTAYVPVQIPHNQYMTLINQQVPSYNHLLLTPISHISGPKPQVAFDNQQHPTYNSSLQHSNYTSAQSHTNLASSRIAVPQEKRATYTTPHVQQTFTKYPANAGIYGQQEWQGNHHPNKNTQITRTSPPNLSPKCVQQCQPQTPVQLAVPLQKSSNVVLSRAEPKITKFEVLKILEVEQQLQLVRQIDSYLINCFSLSQYMSIPQWHHALSTKSLLIEFKTVLDNNIKVAFQDYCIDLPEAKKESKELKETVSKSTDVPNKTENKDNCVQEKVMEEKVTGTTSTDKKKSKEEIQTPSSSATVLRTGEEEIEMLRAMYRELSEPEDNETNEREIPDPEKRQGFSSVDSDQETVIVGDSMVERRSVTTNELEASGEELSSSEHSPRETSTSTTTETEARMHALKATSINQACIQPLSDSSLDTDNDTVSNADLDTSAKDTTGTDWESKDEAQPTIDAEDSDNATITCMSDHDETSEFSKLEDSETTDTQVPGAETHEGLYSPDSDEDTLIVDESAMERSITTDDQMEANSDILEGAVSPKSDQETVKEIDSTRETCTSITNDTAAMNDTWESTNNNGSIKKQQDCIRTLNSSLDSDNATVSNTDLDTSAKDTTVTDLEGKDDTKSMVIDDDEDSEITVIKHIRRMSDRDEIIDTNIDFRSDPETTTQNITEAPSEVEDADNLPENPTFSECPSPLGITIENITSMSIDTFESLGNDQTVIVSTAADSDDIDEMYDNKSCLHCSELGSLVCGGCLKVFCMKHYYSSTGHDHSKECQYLKPVSP